MVVKRLHFESLRQQPRQQWQAKYIRLTGAVIAVICFSGRSICPPPAAVKRNLGLPLRLPPTQRAATTDDIYRIQQLTLLHSPLAAARLQGHGSIHAPTGFKPRSFIGSQAFGIDIKPVVAVGRRWSENGENLKLVADGTNGVNEAPRTEVHLAGLQFHPFSLDHLFPHALVDEHDLVG